MKQIRFWLTTAAILSARLLAAGNAVAQSCTGSDMEPATLSSLQSAARSYTQSAQTGNTAALQQNAEFNLGDMLTTDKELLSGQVAVRSVYLLDNSQTSESRPSGNRAEFYCGIYNSPDRVGFVFEGLPAGRYGVVIEDVTGGKMPAMITWILHQASSQWKIAGLYAKPTQIAGHDANWYISQARTYKSKAQNHNAWFYYLTANDLIRPLPAIGTPQLDKLYDEMQAVKPGDLPFGNPVDLSVGGRVVKVTQVFPTPVGDSLDLVIKYQEPDISDSSKTYQDNMAVIKALVSKYPELREAFGGVVARAVAPNGQDYGSLLAMKDVK
jgi:hypothetical protein